MTCKVVVTGRGASHANSLGSLFSDAQVRRAAASTPTAA